jgi:hypothetical protein
VPTTKTLRLTHWGVDWSEGVVGEANNVVDPEKNDGETIIWCPLGSGGGGWGTGIWFRARSEKIMRLGPGDLSAITSIDTTRWATDVCSTPLRAGDIWATKALDGYIIFKVTEVATDSASIANGSDDWPAKVEYKYSTTTTFN